MTSNLIKPLIIGHRGASALAPENTLAAFRKAIDDGADGIEFDVQLARDGVAVVFHDSTLKRTAGIEGRIDELTSAELAGIDIGSWFRNCAKDEPSADFSDQRVPTLAETLDFLRGFGGLVYIELKCGDANFAPLAKAVCDVIGYSTMLPRIIVKSFKLGAIPEVRKHLPVVNTAALFEPGIMTMICKKEYLAALAAEFGAGEISIHHSLASPELVKSAALRSLPITIWTVDSPNLLRRAIRMGLHAVITNDPAMLLAVRDGPK